MNRRSCWFHSWSRWVTYEDKGHVTRRDGVVVPYVETWQLRTCQKCGRVDTEHVKDGSMPPCKNPPGVEPGG